MEEFEDTTKFANMERLLAEIRDGLAEEEDTHDYTDESPMAIAAALAAEEAGYSLDAEVRHVVGVTQRRGASKPAAAKVSSLRAPNLLRDLVAATAVAFAVASATVGGALLVWWFNY